ncbi:MAG TPA: peptide ABC transporter substrate-binding protein [Candidatus Limnocylindria bacterium]|nr:peptide ABC transporter substrate-binding protein [Candidatus Limnocylindria bacterium]
MSQRGAGGQLKILYWQAPTLLNILLASGTKDADAATLISEGLGTLGADGKPVTRLAAEVPTVENGGVAKDFSSVTWKLKPGLKWSDGSDFTVDDIIFTWQYLADEKTAAFLSDYVQGVKSVEAVDKTTVKINYDSSNPNYYQFGANCCPIIQKAQFKDYIGEKAKDAPGNNAPIGTGPYKLKEFKPGDVVTYVINENYRDKDKPYFKEVQIKGGGDATSAARAVFQTGDADYAWNLQVEAPVLRQLISSGGKGDLITTYAGSVERLMLNFSDPNKEVNGQRSEKSTKHPFFSDKNVRTAFAMAVDRATIAKELYGDGLTGKVTCNIINGLAAFESSNTKSMDACKYDIAAANKKLDDAGWAKGADGIRSKGGVRMKVLYQTTVSSLRQKEQAIIKKGWNDIGVEVELKSVPADVFFTPKSPDSANYFYADVQMFTSGTDPDPTNFLAEWTSKLIAQKENNWQTNNYLRYSNPEYDALVDSLRKETDPKKRSELGIKANDLLISEVVVIPLVNRSSTTDGRLKELKGVKPNAWASSLWDIADWSK